MKDVHLGQPTSVLVAVEENVKLAKILLTITEPRLNPELPKEQLKNTMCGKSVYLFVVPTKWKVLPRNVWKDCELANWTTQQLYKVSTPCIDDHHFKEEETKSVRELSSTCSQIVLKCLYLARIGRLDVLWSVNKLARSITKWTKACDKRLNRLISNIHHTFEYKQYCHVGNTAKTMQIGTVSRLWLRGRSWRFEIYFRENIMCFWQSYICSNKLDV